MTKPIDPKALTGVELSPCHMEARRLAGLGFPVFPCVPGGKAPVVEGGFNAATIDPAKIDEWWTKDPTRNVAMCPDQAGLAVVDVEADGLAEWSDLEAEHGYVWTRTVETPRGGRHLYFRGSIRSTVKKLGPHIDTRGRGGYVLVPPSIVDGKPYTRSDATEPAALPEWITAAVDRPRKHEIAAPDVEWDYPPNVSRAKALIAQTPPAVAGQAGDLAIYRLGAWLGDLAISHELACELCEPWADKCDPPGMSEWFGAKLYQGYKSRENDIGCYATTRSEDATRAAILAKAIEELPPEDRVEAGSRPSHLSDDEWHKLVDSFKGKTPAEDEDLPDLDFWDDDKILPRYPGGTVGICYAKGSALKTTIVSSILMEACIRKGARVAYYAGEGAHMLKKRRIPALMRAMGQEPKDMGGKWRTRSRVMDLNNPDTTLALIEASRDFRPDISAFDTLTTALNGFDEDRPAVGALLGGNGPAGWIRDAFGGVVLFNDHAGKDESRGARGTSAKAQNVDFVWHITANREKGVAKLYVEKLRDGEDMRAIYFRSTKAENGAYVARRITETEYRTLLAGGKEEDSGEGPIKITSAMVGAELVGMGAVAGPEGRSVGTKELAQRFADRFMPPDSEGDDAVRAATLGRVAKHLQLGAKGDTKRGIKPWLNGHVMLLGTGGTNPTLWRFCPTEGPIVP